MENNFEQEVIVEEATIEKKPGMALSITGMVLGILSILTVCCFGGVLGIPGLICSIIGKKKNGHGTAIAGIITSIIGIVGFIIYIIMWILWGVTLSEFQNSLYSYY